MHPRMLESLGLTGVQLQKARAIFEAQERASIPARAELELAHLDLRKLMNADTPDRAAIGSQLDKIGRMQTEMRKAHTFAMLDLRAMLTPEQRKKLEQMRPGPDGPGLEGGRGPGGPGAPRGQ